MAASNPAGGNKFWFNGTPFEGVARSGVDITGLKYWFNGIPMEPLIPAAAGGATFKAAWASGINLSVLGTGTF